MKRSFGIFTLMAVFCGSQAGALNLFGIDFQGLEIEAGVGVISNSVANSAPGPTVNPIGLSLPLKFLGSFTFRPGVQVLFTDHGYASGRAVPVESMFDHVTLLTAMITLPFGYEYEFAPWLKAIGEGGLIIAPRIPVILAGSKAGDMVLDITGWYLAGRQFYTHLNAGVLWQFSELFGLHLYGYYDFPLYNLWTGVVPWDQQLMGINMGIRFTF